MGNATELFYTTLYTPDNNVLIRLHLSDSDTLARAYIDLSEIRAAYG